MDKVKASQAFNICDNCFKELVNEPNECNYLYDEYNDKSDYHCKECGCELD